MPAIRIVRLADFIRSPPNGRNACRRHGQYVRLRRQTNDRTVIVNAKQQIASRLTEKRTNGLEGVGLRPVARTLELDVQVFANGEKRVDS